MQFDHCIRIDLHPRAGRRGRTAGDQVEVTATRINRWRTPHRTTYTAIGHDIEPMLDSARDSIHLEELSLHQRTITVRCHADIDTAIVDNRRTPDEVRWRGT